MKIYFNKFTYSPLGKTFEKQVKTFEEQERKQIDAITNQNKRLAALTNKEYQKENYIELFIGLVQERFDKIKELTDEIDHDDLTYCFTGNTARKRFEDFNNSITRFRKIQSCEMKLEKPRKLQNVFKSNLNEISNKIYKSEKKFKLLYKSQEAVITLFNDYSSTVFEAKYKKIYGNRIPSKLAHVAKVPDRTVSD